MQVKLLGIMFAGCLCASAVFPQPPSVFPWEPKSRNGHADHAVNFNSLALFRITRVGALVWPPLWKSRSVKTTPGTGWRPKTRNMTPKPFTHTSGTRSDQTGGVPDPVARRTRGGGGALFGQAGRSSALSYCSEVQLSIPILAVTVDVVPQLQAWSKKSDV